MKLLVLFLLFSFIPIQAQPSCNEIIELVKSKSYGTTYSSYSSSAISKVTFYEMTIKYDTFYFAIVQFTSSSKEYIYQVGSNTKYNYSMQYLDSAGEAFWAYIHPYNKNLGCAPRFE